MSELNIYDIWNIVESSPPRLREAKLDELCGDDEELKADIRNTINICNEPDIATNIWSGYLKKFVEGDFKPEKLIGQKVGYYTLVRYIAEGGMGHVYYAERHDNILLNQTAAIKVIKPHLVNLFDYDLINREANIMAQLDYKYITKVFDAGVIQYDALKLPCYVMSYIEGSDIAEHHSSSLYSLENRLNCILKICKALHFSHKSDQKIIHSDIKPANILMNLNGDPKLCDFSIAQRAHCVAKNHNVKYAEAFSTHYSCPELKEGKKLTVESDVYSLGLVLYQIITDITPPFDIKNNLPSKHLSSSPDNEKYKRWLPELDAIILKATQIDPQKRFHSMKEFSDELRNFITLKKVNCYQGRFKYDRYKYFFLHPVHATLGLVGAASILSFFTIVLVSSSWLIQQTTDSELTAKLADNYAKGIVNFNVYHQQAIHNGFDIIETHSDASPGLIYQHSMALAKMAVNQGDYNAHYDAITAYKKALTVVDPKDLALTTALMAKSYLAINDDKKAMSIIDPLLNSLAENGFTNISEAHAFLEIFESDVKYISADYDDKRSDLELLNKIDKQYGKLLSKSYRSLNHYYQAVELFYNLGGTDVSPSKGVVAEDYEKDLHPSLLQAKTLINTSLSTIDKYQDNANHRTIATKNFKARILYELQDYRKATQLAKSSTNDAVRLLDIENPLIQKSWRNQYIILRYLNLHAATQSIENAVTSSGFSYAYNDIGMLDTYLLGISYLYQGDVINIQKQINQAFKYFEKYQKDSDLRGIIGLDSVTALLINYLEFTSFDNNNDAFIKVVNTLNQVMLRTKKDFPDYMSDYEMQMVQLYKLFSERKYNDVMNMVGNVITARKNKTSDQKDKLSQILLNMAMIVAQIENKQELALELANMAEKLFIWSELEKTHSPVKMNIYLQLAKIYQTNNKTEKYHDAMEQAEIVYTTHYNTLTNSFYAPMFEQNFQLSWVQLQKRCATRSCYKKLSSH
ncbi:MAG: serine/threonine protein kinase [Alteromonadaceae bacterium]|nr:serine/threonine protein kinase [Alteromonadaceae bacterium]